MPEGKSADAPMKWEITASCLGDVAQHMGAECVKRLAGNGGRKRGSIGGGGREGERAPQCLAGRYSAQVFPEPIGGQARDLFQCSGFFKQMCCARHDLQLFDTSKLGQRVLVQMQDDIIQAADNQ